MTGACVLATACRQGSAEKKVVARPIAVQSNATPTPTPEPEQSVKDFISGVWPLTKERAAGLRRAWARVPRNSDYRVARSADFGEARMVHNYGEIAGAYGLALMIVNKTKTNNDRFSLVIFIERPGDRYSLYWIYRDRDLRASRLSRSSGSLFVETSEKSREVCRIQWTRSKGEWTCEN